MSPKESNRKVDFSEAYKKPESIDTNSEIEEEGINPDDYLSKTPEDETEQNQLKNVVDDQMIIANLGGS